MPEETVMVTPSGVRPPPPLNLKDNPVEGWKLFKQGWGNYIIITDPAQKENKYQGKRRCFSTVLVQVYNTFNLPEDDSTKLKDIVQKFEEFIIGETNETYERYKFNQRTQKSAETTDQFVTALKTLSYLQFLRLHERNPYLRPAGHRNQQPGNKEKASGAEKTLPSKRN